jgi:hypothetical protein
VVIGNYLFDEIQLSFATLASIVLVSVSLYLYNSPPPPKVDVVESKV